MAHYTQELFCTHGGPRHSYPSAPASGEPGSRFNPVVRVRRPQTRQPAALAPGLITSADTPKASPSFGADLVGRMGALMGKAGAEGSNKAPVSERFNYQFEQPQTPEGSESEYGG